MSEAYERSVNDDCRPTSTSDLQIKSDFYTPMFTLTEMSGAGWNEALQRIDAEDEFWERLQNDQVSNVVLDVCRRSTST